MQERVDLCHRPVDPPARAHLSPVEDELFLGCTQLRHISPMTELTELTVRCQDNSFALEDPLSRLLDSSLARLDSEQVCEVVAKLLQCIEPLRRSLDNFALRLKDFAAFSFGEHAHDFAHAPAGRAQDLQTVHSRHEQGNTVVAHYSNAPGKAFEGLQLKSRKVQTLELFGGIRHGKNW